MANPNQVLIIRKYKQLPFKEEQQPKINASFKIKNQQSSVNIKHQLLLEPIKLQYKNNQQHLERLSIQDQLKQFTSQRESRTVNRLLNDQPKSFIQQRIRDLQNDSLIDMKSERTSGSVSVIKIALPAQTTERQTSPKDYQRFMLDSEQIALPNEYKEMIQIGKIQHSNISNTTRGVDSKTMKLKLPVIQRVIQNSQQESNSNNINQESNYFNQYSSLSVIDEKTPLSKVINKQRQKSMVVKKNLEIKPINEDGQQSGIFSGMPSNSNNNQILHHIISKSQISSRQFIPQVMRDTFQNIKKSQQQQLDMRKQIKIMEQNIKKASERNKKQIQENEKLKNSLSFIQTKFEEYQSKPQLVNQFVSNRASSVQIGLCSYQDSHQNSSAFLSPFNHNGMSPNIVSNASMLNIQENTYQTPQNNNNIQSQRSVNVYEYLIVEDLRKELINAKQRVEEAFLKKGPTQVQIEALREENKSLAKVVLRYQVMAREVNNNSFRNQSQLDIGSQSPKNYISSFNVIGEELTKEEIFIKENIITVKEHIQDNIVKFDSRTRSPSNGSTLGLGNEQFMRSINQSLGVSSMNDTTIGDRKPRKSFASTGSRMNDQIMDITTFEQLVYQIHFIVRDKQKFFDQLLLFIEQIIMVFKILYRICKMTLDCENCVLFVCDYYLEKRFIKAIKKERIHLLRKTYIGGNPYTVILLSESQTPDEYLPKSVDDFNKGIFKDQGMLHQVFDSQGKTLMAIQVTKPKQVKTHKSKSQRPKNFTSVDQVKLKMLARFLGLKTEILLLKEEENIKAQKVFSILDCCNNIVHKRTHKDIILAMRRELPKLFDFHHCCCFFFDPAYEDIFTVNADINEKKSSDEGAGEVNIIRFPTSLGLTGTCCKERNIIYSNQIEHELRFNSDIDNLLAIHNIKNILVSEICVEDPKMPPVGVIQLINKKGIEPINEYDVGMINALRAFLGTCVDNITVVNYSVKVTLSVSQETSGILKHIDYRDEQGTDNKLGYEVMFKNMIAIKRFLDVLQKPHRGLAFDMKKLKQL